MMTPTIVPALAQARLADLHDQARRDGLARAARRARRARRPAATHRAAALLAALSRRTPPPALATKHDLDQRHAARAGTTHAPTSDVMMSFNRPETQTLGYIEHGLAGSDPRLASMLNIFSQLAAGEEMPVREKIRIRRERPTAIRPRRTWPHPRRGMTLPQARRLHQRLGRQQAMLLLWAGISAALLTIALALTTSGHKASCIRLVGTACPSPPSGSGPGSTLGLRLGEDPR